MKETDLYKAKMLAKNFFEMIISKAEMLLVIVRHLLGYSNSLTFRSVW